VRLDRGAPSGHVMTLPTRSHASMRRAFALTIPMAITEELAHISTASHLETLAMKPCHEEIWSAGRPMFGTSASDATMEVAQGSSRAG